MIAARAPAWPWLPLAALLGACGASSPHLGTDARREQARAIEAVLDDWHAAAAASDEERYFAHLAPDSVFLGTDATERWSKQDFRAYAHPHFEAGHGWVFRAVRRDVSVDPRGRLAWFDEDLETEGLGPARGAGVLRRGDDGRWRIVLYDLALTVPNERFAEVRALLASASPPVIERTTIPDTPAHRAAIAAVERYRAALLAGDADAVLAMVSPRYHDAAGTADAGDDLDAEALRSQLRAMLSSAEVLELELTYERIVEDGERVHVDVRERSVYRVGDQARTRDEEHRFTLERDATGLRFVSGL